MESLNIFHRINDAIGAAVHERKTIQISVDVTDEAYPVICDLIEGRFLDGDDWATLEKFAEAIHYGFLGYGFMGGKLNAPWLVKYRLLCAKLGLRRR